MRGLWVEVKGSSQFWRGHLFLVRKWVMRG